MESINAKRLNLELAKKITNPIWGLYLTIIMLPFVSNEIMLVLCALVISMYFLNASIKGKQNIVKTPIDLPILLFAAVQIISTVTSVTPILSLQNLIVSLLCILVYFVTVNCIETKEELDKMIKLFMIVAFALSCLGVIQYFTLGTTSKAWVDLKTNPDLKTRVIGTFGNPNVFAEYLEHILPAAIALILAYKKPGKKIITAIMAGAMFICLVLTFSRAAWIGIVAAMGLLMLLKYAKLIPLFITAGLASIPLLPKVIIQRLMSINLQDTSNSYRMHIWEGTINMIKDFWVTGVGFGYWAFKNTFLEYSIKGTRAWHSHNLYLETLAEVGVFGFLSFLWLILILFKSTVSFIKETKDKYLSYLSTGLLCGVLSILVHGLAEHILYMPKSVLMFWLMIGFIMAARTIGMKQIHNASEET